MKIRRLILGLITLTILRNLFVEIDLGIHYRPLDDLLDIWSFLLALSSCFWWILDLRSSWFNLQFKNSLRTILVLIDCHNILALSTITDHRRHLRIGICFVWHSAMYLRMTILMIPSIPFTQLHLTLLIAQHTLFLFMILFIRNILMHINLFFFFIFFIFLILLLFVLLHFIGQWTQPRCFFIA